MKLTKQFLTGISDIDSQHERFVSILNDIRSKMGLSPDPGKVISHIDDLKEYAKMHFATEEAKMKEVAYPDANEHVRQHSELLKKIIFLEKEYKSENSKKAIYDLIDFVETWLLTHIPDYDKVLGDYMKKMSHN